MSNLTFSDIKTSKTSKGSQFTTDTIEQTIKN